MSLNQAASAFGTLPAELAQLALSLRAPALSVALQIDLAATGLSVSSLPADVAGMHKAGLAGPFLLQLVGLWDITETDESRRDRAGDATLVSDSANRTLKLHLTDGLQNVYAMEYKRIAELSTGTAAGTKLLVHNVTVRRGMLLLTPACISVLGGSGAIGGPSPDALSGASTGARASSTATTASTASTAPLHASSTATPSASANANASINTTRSTRASITANATSSASATHGTAAPLPAPAQNGPFAPAWQGPFAMPTTACPSSCSNAPSHTESSQSTLEASLRRPGQAQPTLSGNPPRGSALQPFETPHSIAPAQAQQRQGTCTPTAQPPASANWNAANHASTTTSGFPVKQQVMGPVSTAYRPYLSSDTKQQPNSDAPYGVPGGPFTSAGSPFTSDEMPTAQPQLSSVPSTSSCDYTVQTESTFHTSNPNSTCSSSSPQHPAKQLPGFLPASSLLASNNRSDKKQASRASPEQHSPPSAQMNSKFEKAHALADVAAVRRESPIHLSASSDEGQNASTGRTTSNAKPSSSVYPTSGTPHGQHAQSRAVSADAGFVKQGLPYARRETAVAAISDVPGFKNETAHAHVAAGARMTNPCDTVNAGPCDVDMIDLDADEGDASLPVMDSQRIKEVIEGRDSNFNGRALVSATSVQLTTFSLADGSFICQALLAFEGGMEQVLNVSPLLLKDLIGLSAHEYVEQMQDPATKKACKKRARDVNQMFRGLYGLFEIENSAQGLFIAKLPAERAYQPATPQGA